MKKVRCENCDCVIDVEGDYCEPEASTSPITRPAWWDKPCKCYNCNSFSVRSTSEPYRLPKWERSLTPVAGKGWRCPDCDTINNEDFGFCGGCGATRHR